MYGRTEPGNGNGSGNGDKMNWEMEICKPGNGDKIDQEMEIDRQIE